MRNFMESVQHPWKRKWPDAHTIPAGTVLYHGTDMDEEDFDPENDYIETPIWVSDSLEVAKNFSRGGRILKFEVTEPITLPVISSGADRERMEEKFNIDFSGVEDMKDSIAASIFPGWFIPRNYPDGGSDILLVDDAELTLIDVTNAANN